LGLNKQFLIWLPKIAKNAKTTDEIAEIAGHGEFTPSAILLNCPIAELKKL
jgi:hypothetical protein